MMVQFKRLKILTKEWRDGGHESDRFDLSLHTTLQSGRVIAFNGFTIAAVADILLWLTPRQVVSGKGWM